jgi:chemotaxis protein CheZ
MSHPTQVEPQLVEALLTALNSQQTEQASALLDEITQIRASELYAQLTHLTQNLHKTLDDLNHDDSLLIQTKHDIPDATERLQYVISATEEASNKTLNSTENALSALDSLEESLKSLLTDDQAWSIKTSINQIQNELTQIMLAQSFQDLTGQVLNRVILIISSLEQSLVDLISRSGHDYDAIPMRIESLEAQQTNQAKGIGPNVTAASKRDSAGSQDDVDDLLSQLGI